MRAHDQRTAANDPAKVISRKGLASRDRSLRPDREQRPAEAIYPALLVIVMLLVLPHFGPVAMMIGSALGLAGQVLVMPDHFRSRSGSLVPAIVFVTAFGLAMGVVAVLSLVQG